MSDEQKHLGIKVVCENRTGEVNPSVYREKERFATKLQYKEAAESSLIYGLIDRSWELIS